MFNLLVGFPEGSGTERNIRTWRSPVSAPLLQDDGSGRIYAQLAKMARWTRKDAGRVIATFKPNPPWFLTLPWVAIGLVILALGFPVNPEFFPVAVAIFVPMFGGTALAAWMWARSQKTHVAERALIVGIRRHIIPFATIDPGRVAVSSRLRYLGVHMHSGGMRTLQSQGPTAVVNGLDPKPGAWNRYSPRPARRARSASGD